MIYLHNEQISSENFRRVLSNHAVKHELEQHCVLWPWDCTEEDAKLKLREILKQCAELNVPIAPFPVPFGLDDDITGGSAMPTAASIIAARISSTQSSTKFPYLFIIIQVSLGRERNTPITPSAATSASISSSSTVDTGDAPASSSITLTSSSPADSVQSDSGSANAISNSSDANVLATACGITANSVITHSIRRCCFRELPGVTLSAMELVSLLSAYNNYNSINTGKFMCFLFLQLLNISCVCQVVPYNLTRL